jgi:hypothetical protein
VVGELDGGSGEGLVGGGVAVTVTVAVAVGVGWTTGGGSVEPSVGSTGGTWAVSTGVVGGGSGKGVSPVGLVSGVWLGVGLSSAGVFGESGETVGEGTLGTPDGDGFGRWVTDRSQGMRVSE